MQPLERTLERFEQISAVPRGTKHEAQIRAWLANWALEHGFASRTDKVGNIVIEVPPGPGYEGQPPVVLQGHMDMVWQKTSDSDHDFTRDPIRLIRDGDWIRADRTTLGADNGIAIALMLALAEERGLPHPPLEFLLTVEEEMGFTGVFGIQPGMVTGKVLLNLDSEDDGVLTLGCAGGCTVFIDLPVEWEAPGPQDGLVRLHVGGLKGGHSGGDINKHRANANKVLARALAHVEPEATIRLGALKGGTVRNAIPREAEAVFACPEDDEAWCRDRLAAFGETVRQEYALTDGGLWFRVEAAGRVEKVVNVADTRKILRFLRAVPNGVSEMSAEMEGFVETSNSVGIVELLEDGFHAISSQRSAVGSRLEEITSRVEALAGLAGAQTRRNVMTQPWQPDHDSPLLKRCIQVYERCLGETPRLELTHGGLECGVLSSRLGPLDAISLGPTIVNAHSPDESLFVPSVQRIWQFLTALLGSFGEGREETVSPASASTAASAAADPHRQDS